MNRKLLAALLVLALALLPCAALAATANASVVAPKTYKVTAPYSGTLLPFHFVSGDSVTNGQILFTFDTVPVYAPHDGIVAAVFAEAGDDASGVAAEYGALAVLEPEYPLFVAANTAQAYDKNENRYVHAGESVYLKCGNDEGTGLVTAVNDKNFTVKVLTGNFELDDSVRCFRERNCDTKSEIGRGKLSRFPDTLVNAAGRVVNAYVRNGQRVKTGDLLFELLDASCPAGAETTITAPASGAIGTLAVASGQQVYRGQLLCEITDLTRLELSAEVDEMDLVGIKVGDTLSFTLDAYADETFSGTVKEIRPIGRAKQNATYFDVRLTLPEGRSLLPGMNGTVTLN